MGREVIPVLTATAASGGSSLIHYPRNTREKWDKIPLTSLLKTKIIIGNSTLIFSCTIVRGDIRRDRLERNYFDIISLKQKKYYLLK